MISKKSEFLLTNSVITGVHTPAGDHTKECTDDASVCLTAQKLKKIQRVALWGEGAGGKAHLEIKSIYFSKAKTVAEQQNDLTQVEEIVGGFLKGALKAEGFDDINKCIHDGSTIIKDSEDAYAHFSKKDVKDVVAGLTDVVDIIKTVEAGMSDCSHIVADWKKLTDMVAIFSSPESFAYHVGKDLLVNGVDIFHEIEGAVSNFESKKWSTFGEKVGEATAEVHLGSEFQAQLEEMDLGEAMFLHWRKKNHQRCKLKKDAYMFFYLYVFLFVAGMIFARCIYNFYQYVLPDIVNQKQDSKTV